jgi:hypothetical protein
MDEAGIRSLIDPHRFVGRAPEQVDRFLDDQVMPVLDRLGPIARGLGAPEIHV